MSVWKCDDCGDPESVNGISTEWSNICNPCYTWSLSNHYYTTPLTNVQQSAETFAQLPPASDDFWDL